MPTAVETSSDARVRPARAARASRSCPGSGTASRHAHRATFWTLMLGRIQVDHPDWSRSRNPGSQNWFGMPSRYAATPPTPWPSATTTSYAASSIANADPARVAAVYAALRCHKDRIEHLFGEPLTWGALPPRRAKPSCAVKSTALTNQPVTKNVVRSPLMMSGPFWVSRSSSTSTVRTVGNSQVIRHLLRKAHAPARLHLGLRDAACPSSGLAASEPCRVAGRRATQRPNRPARTRRRWVRADYLGRNSATTAATALTAVSTHMERP
jgi:hypothetical protein